MQNLQQHRWPVHRGIALSEAWKVVAFTYLPSAEQESGFRIAITGFVKEKDVKTRLSGV